MAYASTPRRLAATAATAAAMSVGRDLAKYGFNRLTGRSSSRKMSRFSSSSRQPRQSAAMSQRQRKRYQMSIDTGTYNNAKGENVLVNSFVGTDLTTGTGYNERSSAYIYLTGIRVEYNFTYTGLDADDVIPTQCHLVVTKSERDSLPQTQWWNSRNQSNESTQAFTEITGWTKNTHEMNKADFSVLHHSVDNLWYGKHSISKVEFVKFKEPIRIRFKADKEALFSLSPDSFFPKIGVHLFAQSTANTGTAAVTNVSLSASSTVYFKE